jgi:hypothetical protein
MTDCVQDSLQQINGDGELKAIVAIMSRKFILLLE